MHARILTAMCLLAPTTPLFASHLVVQVDPGSTTVDFHLQATLHSVRGTMTVESGTIEIDFAKGTATGEIVVDSATAATGNSKRDKKMHLRVLQSAVHPRIVLHTQSFEGDLARHGTSTITLHGDIEILGLSHAVAMPIKVEITGDRFSAEVELAVPYVEWGLEDPSTFVLRVAKTVDVTVVAQGTVREPDDSELADPS